MFIDVIQTGMTELIYACYLGNIDRVEILLQQSVSLNEVDYVRYTK